MFGKSHHHKGREANNVFMNKIIKMQKYNHFGPLHFPVKFHTNKSGLILRIVKFKHITEIQHEVSINVVCVASKASYQPAHMRSLIRAFASRLNILGVLSY